MNELERMYKLAYNIHLPPQLALATRPNARAVRAHAAHLAAAPVVPVLPVELLFFTLRV